MAANAYGTIYTPSSISNLPTFGKGGIASLKEAGIRYVRIQWNDYTNTTRYRIVPISAFEKLLAASRPGIGLAKAALGLIGITLAPGFSGTGEHLYVPDMSSIRPCGYASNHASVMGWLEEKLPLPGKEGKDAYKVATCPRGILKGIVDDARLAGVEFLVGVETEFILLSSTDPIEAVNDYNWSASAAIPSGTDLAACLEEIADALQASGIELLMYHAEAAPGQYEIVTGPLPPLEAADALILTRETIYNIASKYDLTATLTPRLYADNCGSAAHTHISVHSTGYPPNSPPRPNPDTNKKTTMTPLERSFVQSLLTHLPALAAITLPTVASYDRVQDGVWSGGTYPSWGTENREAPIRVTGAPGAHHFEVRCMDGTASPYLALAAFLGAGMIGVYEGQELEIEEVEVGAAELSEEERIKRGIVGRMPRTLSEARSKLLEDKVMHKVLGEEFVEKYLSVNKTWETFLNKGDAKAKTQLMIQNY